MRLPADFCAVNGPSAKRLDLSYNRIATLEGLDKFEILEELILDNNDVTDEAISKLPHLPNLHTLSANKNNIKDTDALLNILREKCSKLNFLSLLGNDACPNELLGSGHDDNDYKRYRLYVVFRCPTLKFLDSRIVSEEERKEAKRVGQFMKVVKPSQESLEGTEKEDESSSPYSPLPEVTGHQQRVVSGKVKYVYHGKQSEGNRFIRNSQL